MADAEPVFAALADPTRRRVLTLLKDGERSVAELTGQLPVSQSAVSQHLKVLREAGLVSSRAAGTRRLYRVDRDGLSEVRAFVDQFWDEVLDAFTEFASRPASPDQLTEPQSIEGAQQ